MDFDAVILANMVKEWPISKYKIALLNYLTIGYDIGTI